MEALRIDPLHACIALGPLAMYLLVLGGINLSSRPFLTTGGRDLIALGIAISGLVAAGPMELFFPETAAAFFGGWVWAMMLVIYGLAVILLAMTQRPRLVIYNIAIEQLRPLLDDLIREHDPDARWAGESLMLPQLGVQLHVEPSPMTRNVQLVAIGSYQNYNGWRYLEQELSEALRSVRSAPNPYGASLLSFGLALAVAITFWLARDPGAVTQALNDMLRR